MARPQMSPDGDNSGHFYNNILNGEAICNYYVASVSTLIYYNINFYKLKYNNLL